MWTFKATFVHISNISAITDQILPKIFGSNFFGSLTFVLQIFFCTSNFFGPLFLLSLIIGQIFLVLTFFGPKIFLDPHFFWSQIFSGSKFFFSGPTFFLVQKIFSEFFFQSQNFSQPKLFQPKFFPPNFFFQTKIFFWPKTIFGLIFFRPKTMFVGRKQSFWSLSSLNWQRTKALLKLEFDTKDQVLFLLVLNRQTWIYIMFTCS